MTWSKTYSHNVLIALDCLGAALLFNRNDVTISTLCRIVQLSDAKAAHAAWQLSALGLRPCQVTFLRWLGPFLDDLQKNHCAEALQGDVQRANSIKSLLEP